MAEKELRAPVYGLLIAPEPDMREAVHNGEKTITVREGWRDYKAGAHVALFCHKAPWAVMATLTEVRHTTVRELTLAECQDDGAQDQEDLLAGLKRFYKAMTMDSPVTVIRWKDPQGYWVDHANEYDGAECSL